MFQGQSMFSGWNVPRGSGIHVVMGDCKVLFTANKKERALMKAKVSARNVKWTDSSRAFYKKNNKKEKVEEKLFTITKKVRGFNLLPSKLVEKAPKKTTTLPPKGGEKVHKNANLR
ncbi:hypothetical protein ECANGB1_2029 [Enterospora canceri]|uniref:Large ribosomal subunit protein eL24-related N-terminal domain-containing protein n=1 Tax=Enterospora canceri TaxID=1081671 RepID=A0A1Y1S564_9MICR|nr:hypothetical protein ECANGB1_2029 [Enterospora canceri]